MGKAKFVILAVIVLLVQTSSSAGFVKVSDNVKVQNAVVADDCDWPMFGRTPDGNRVVPDGCGLKSVSLVEKWTKQIPNHISVFSHYDPIIVGSKMYISYPDYVFYCVDTNNGNILWKYACDQYIWGSAYDNGRIFFASKAIFYCLNAESGEAIWKVSIPKMRNSSAGNIIVYNNRIYFTSHYEEFFCIDATNGSTIWIYSRPKDGWEGRIGYGAALSNNKIYYNHNHSTLYCLDALTGSKKWIYDTKKRDKKTSNVLVASGKVYFSTESQFYCVDQETGSEVWKNSYINDGAVYYQGNLFINCRGSLVVMSPETGDVFWENDEVKLLGVPIICSNKVFCKSSQYNSIYILSSRKKELFAEIESPNINAFAILKNQLLILGGLGYLSSFEDGIPPVVAKRIEFINPPKNVDLCSKTQFLAKVFDKKDKEIPNPSLQWIVDGGNGTIDANGLLTPSKLGKVTILCKCADVSASVSVNVVDSLFIDTEGIRIDILKPFEKVSKKFTLKNNGDTLQNITLSSSIGTVVVNPPTLTLAAEESREIEVSSQINQIEPIPDTEFTITISAGSCTKQIKGILTQSWPFACVSISPQTLDFGQIRRGDSKTIQLTFISKVKTSLSITPSEQWITILPSRTISIEADAPTVVDFKINASSLPAASKLSANVIIETNLNYCDKMAIPLTVMTEDSITIKLQVNSRNATINDQERTLDVPAQIVAGRTMVPLRFISESFGCSIDWEAKTQKISIIRYDITVNLWIGKDYVEVNGSRLKIDSPPVIIGGRTMVPLRFIAEPFGADVRWDAQTKGITIIWPKP